MEYLQPDRYQLSTGRHGRVEPASWRHDNAAVRVGRRQRGMWRLATSLTSCVCLAWAMQGSLYAESHVDSGISVTANHSISSDEQSVPHVESQLAIDPKNPRHMIAASLALDKAGSLYSAFYVTMDGGATWHRSRGVTGGPLEKGFFKGGDPAVIFSPSGAALAITGGTLVDRGGRVSKTFVSRSTDGGLTWQTPVALPYRDRPWIAIDSNVYGATSRRVFLIGQYGKFIVSTSDDDGKSFTPGDLFIAKDANRTSLWPLPSPMQVTSDGVLIEPFVTADLSQLAEMTDKSRANLIRLFVSEDGGRTFTMSAYGPNIVQSKKDRTISDPMTALDVSKGPNAGRLYIAFTALEEGRNVIGVASTSDLGKTWRSVVVNDDHTGHDPDNPAVAVSGDGVVAVTWNDRRDDPDGNCWRLYGAISIDGGEHFLQNAPLSHGLTCPTAEANWIPESEGEFDPFVDPKHPLPAIVVDALIPARFSSGGDTQGLAADSNGVFHAAWINGESGSLSLYQTDFAVDSSLLRTLRVKGAAGASGASNVPKGMIDVSEELRFRASDPVIDFAHHAVSVAVNVSNPTTRSFEGPIQIVLAHMFDFHDKGMGLKHIQVANSDNGQKGEGAMWRFTVGGDGVLRPDQKTEARVLRFSFEGGPPAVTDGYLSPRFYVFAKGEVTASTLGPGEVPIGENLPTKAGVGSSASARQPRPKSNP